MAKKFKKNKKKNDKSDEIESKDNYVSFNKDENQNQNIDDDEMDELETQRLVMEKRKKKGKSGGFQSMGLSYPVLKAILRKGYKVPTPIQRKTIPLITEGKDVVAMARTGSGKTAAFLIPLFEKLKIHKAQSGARGLILSPTRELALQTLKFAKELGKNTNLKFCCVLGGDNMEKQFASLHDNPDIIIATPGRLLHVVVEMNLKLLSVEYIVFDEADRLFEMGFQEQLNEILTRLSTNRQTLLFSATLPQTLIDFTKAGLSDPVLVRLDTESKLSENLKTVYLNCREDDKIGILLHLLKLKIQPEEMTVIFVPTRHHVEYLKDVLEISDIKCTYLYSSLDQFARKNNVYEFQKKRVKIMLVTDVAARGVDIPMLDNVINLNFPSKPKLFVHRVGRVARAGRSGTAYSLIGPDEAPFMHSLHLFLDKPIKFPQANMSPDEDGIFGCVPQTFIDEEAESLNQWHFSNVDLQNMKKVCKNAYKQYIKSREAPASESVKKMKELLQNKLDVHPIFNSSSLTNDIEKRNDLLNSIKNYKSNTTIFEIGKTKKNCAYEIMQAKRKMFDKIVNKSKNLNDSLKSENIIEESKSFKDNEFYLNYQSTTHYSEKGLELEKPFNAEMASAAFDISGDDVDTMKKSKNMLKW